MIMSWALLAPVVGLGAAGLSTGCGDSLKSDGQIQAAPEDSKVAEAVSKNYGEEMKKKYAGQMKGNR
jgi:hypothetical protein